MKAVVISNFPKTIEKTGWPILFIHNVSLSEPIQVKYVRELHVVILLRMILTILRDQEYDRTLCLENISDIIRCGYVQGTNLYRETREKKMGKSLLIYVKGGLIRFIPITFNRFVEGSVLYHSYLEVIIVYDSPLRVLQKALKVALSKFRAL